MFLLSLIPLFCMAIVHVNAKAVCETDGAKTYTTQAYVKEELLQVPLNLTEFNLNDQESEWSEQCKSLKVLGKCQEWMEREKHRHMYLLFTELEQLDVFVNWSSINKIHISNLLRHNSSRFCQNHKDVEVCHALHHSIVTAAKAKSAKLLGELRGYLTSEVFPGGEAYLKTIMEDKFNATVISFEVTEKQLDGERLNLSYTFQTANRFYSLCHQENKFLFFQFGPVDQLCDGGVCEKLTGQCKDAMFGYKIC